MQFVEAFDTDNDGVVSKVEWQKGMKMMNLRYHDALEVNIDKLTSRCVRLALARARLLAAMAADGLVDHVVCPRLMFEDEKTTCGTAACSFFVFTALYIVVLSLQVS